MKKYVISIISLFGILSSTYSQSDNRSESFMCGSCQKVVEHIRTNSVDNDSTIIEIIKRDYEVSGNQSILKRSPAEVIKYFNTDEGQKVMCTYRKLSNKNTKVLLITD